MAAGRRRPQPQLLIWLAACWLQAALAAAALCNPQLLDVNSDLDPCTGDPDLLCEPKYGSALLELIAGFRMMLLTSLLLLLPLLLLLLPSLLLLLPSLLLLLPLLLLLLPLLLLPLLLLLLLLLLHFCCCFCYF